MDQSAALTAVFEPVRAPSTFEETVARLSTAIKLGLLVPGSRLPSERELAAVLRISRSTLRQALTTLVQAGHLVSVRGRGGGTFVAESLPSPPAGAPPRAAVLHGALDHRVAIETGAAVLAAERAGPEDLDRMSALVETMYAAQDFEQYRRADSQFHIALAEAAGSPRLVADMTASQGEMTELIALIPHPEAVLTRSNDQHRRIVSMLARGDAAAAVLLVREHLVGTEHILTGLMPGAAGLTAVRAGA